MPDGQVGPARLSKEEVNYRNGEKCLTCTYFFPLNSCALVAGNISPEGLCDKYALLEAKPNTGKAAEFYREEFVRAKGGSV
ncbi:MAG: hypothetical protein ACXABY_20270 [Candidatus Thorarchaeota archaeon]|jgi:hypothetical protein